MSTVVVIVFVTVTLELNTQMKRSCDSQSTGFSLVSRMGQKVIGGSSAELANVLVYHMDRPGGIGSV